MDDETSHLRVLAQSMDLKIQNLEVLLKLEKKVSSDFEKRINDCIEYLLLMAEDRTLTPVEKAIAELSLQYLRG